MEKLIAKNQSVRFEKYVEVQNELLATGKSLVVAESYEAAYERFKRIVAHAEGLWEDACHLFTRGRYPTALAMSITCVEEIGKIGVARFQLALDENARQKGRSPKLPLRVKHRARPFYSHTQKLLLAAGAGALVNARLDRILGLAPGIDFLDRVERNEIEIQRQSCLYADANEEHLLLPAEQIGREAAEFYVVLAGELLAEVGGFEPEEFEILLEKAQAFERSIGHASE